MKTEQFKQQIEEQLERYENEIEYPFNPTTNANRTFVRDGIIRIEDYLNAPIKILWVLKEANSEYDDIADMREALANLQDENNPDRITPKWGKTFNPIAYSTYGIFEKMDWLTLPDIDGNASEVLKHMPKIAYINVKKYAGVNQTHDPEVHQFYGKYKGLLFEQICLINPDVIIFGGTHKYFSEEDMSNQLGTISNVERVADEPHYFHKYQCGNKLLLNTYHPNARADKQLYCDSIINAVNSWREKNN